MPLTDEEVGLAPAPKAGLSDAEVGLAPEPTPSSSDAFTMAGILPLPKSFYARMAKGFADYPSDVADIFMEGAHITKEAVTKPPSEISPENKEIGAKIKENLLGAGATEEEANRESERLMKTLEQKAGYMNMIFGPMQMAAAPVLAPFRSFVSRPIE